MKYKMLTKKELEEIDREIKEFPVSRHYGVDKLLNHTRALEDKIRKAEELFGFIMRTVLVSYPPAPLPSHKATVKAEYITLYADIKKWMGDGDGED